MRIFISLFMVLSLFLMACNSPVEEVSTPVDNGVEVDLSSEANLQKVSFVNEGGDYLYSFSFDEDLARFLGYPLEGMSENGGAFRLANDAEIVSSTENATASGISEQVGDFQVFVSKEEEGGCVFEYRVVLNASDNLSFRAKSCEGQDPDLASQVLDVMLESLSIDAL